MHHVWRVWIHFNGNCCMEKDWEKLNELFVFSQGRLRGGRDALLMTRQTPLLG